MDGRATEAKADRRQRVRNTLKEIGPDILCLVEGPRGEAGIKSFAKDVLGGAWTPVFLPESKQDREQRDREYKTKGPQWIWFLVRTELRERCRLQNPSVWQSFTDTRKWKVHYWGSEAPSEYGHYRHPQVLIVDLEGGSELEIIGVHLKAKKNDYEIERDENGNIVGNYLDEALKARVKLATQARDVRRYIDARFEQTPDPAIVVLGDVNDGPGHDFFERHYLFFDLIGNLQGSIVKPRRFLSHALFDYPDRLRWTARYRDEVNRIPASRNPLLIDHVLLSEALVSGESHITAGENSGMVEHQAYERGNAGATANRRTSDHRPISVVLS